MKYSGENPFFTIGVPTYNRQDLLRETLDSILAQSFTDFEIIVGNDYTAELLAGEIIGITDPRLRFVNHSRNLREVGNMNSLLALASGRYFTWLFDDDLYEPDYLATAYEFLTNHDFPPAFFPSFKLLWGSDPFRPQKVHAGKKKLFSGREFLAEYFDGNVKIVSTSGLFETTSLRSIVGGVEEMYASVNGLYCEYLFLVRCALLGKIGYENTRLVVMRRHTDSWGLNNREPQMYEEAGRELIRRSSEIFRHPDLADDFKANMMGICRLHLYSYTCMSAKVEFAQHGFGIGSARRSCKRLGRETTIFRGLFEDATDDRGWKPYLVFLLTQVRLSFFTMALLTVTWLRKFRPGFLQLTGPETPK